MRPVDPAFLLPEAREQQRGIGARLSASRLRQAVSVTVICAILVVLAIWMLTSVERSLRELRAATLVASVDAEVIALSGWVSERLRDAERWARDPRVRSIANALEDARRVDGAPRPCDAAVQPRWRSVVATAVEAEGALAVNLVSRDGRIVAAMTDAHCGQPVLRSTFWPRIEDVFAGKTSFLRPLPERERLLHPSNPALSRPVAWVEAPVHDEHGRIVAALGIAYDADEAFRSIFTAAQPGLTGEAYAFDENGVLLSEPRFVQALRDAQRLSGKGRAAYRLRLVAHETPAQPLSAPAGSAVAAALARAGGGPGTRDGEGGSVLGPYVNYRGATVVGAWRWLPDLRMGVVVEIEASEVYAPLAYVRASVALALVLLVLAAGWAAWSTLAWVRLAQHREPRRIGAYRMERELAQGGMATVHLARHQLLKRPTAVKILKRHLATDELIARFEREVRLASELDHPNTIEIYDYGQTRDGLFYYAMEYIEGLTLAELVQREGAQPAGRAVAIARQVCAAAAEVHGKGLVHRDLKPDNVMLTVRGGEPDFVKLLDFGIVKRVDPANGAHRHPDDGRALTRDVRLLGTPAYLAPERIGDPARVDVRSDLYGIGAILFHLLCGRAPFESKDSAALLRDVISAPAPRVASLAPRPVPEALDSLVARCLAKDPDERPGNVSEVMSALAEVTCDDWTRSDAEAWWTRWRKERAQPAPSGVDHGQ